MRFQPTKRPQLAAQKAKAKAIASRLAALPKQTEAKAAPNDDDTPAGVAKPDGSPAANTPPPAQKLTADDWRATAEDDEDTNAYYAINRQRGGRKKRKKNKEQVQHVQYDWDDIYDPTRPNSYEEYKNSDEKIREVREWKDLLYRHRLRRNKPSDMDTDSERDAPRNGKLSHTIVCSTLTSSAQFAPPASFGPPSSFAPPAEFTEAPPPPPTPEDDVYIPPAAGVVPQHVSGEDAWTRRMQLSGMVAPPPPPADKPPAPPDGQISRAPVRYSLPAADPDLPASQAELEAMELDDTQAEEDAPRSIRPGQAKFAERLMAKYGWSKGQGLGKEGTGLTSALYAKADKRKKKSDAEGGGFVTPAQTGRIMGGGKSKAGKEAEGGKFGAMSEVVRLEGMLQGIDVQAEIMREDGNIMQEIGEECGEKYGNVERVYIHSNPASELGALVFVHFTQPLSALRAVNALEGRVFNGNTIKAIFWPKEKFDQREYE